MSKFRMEGPYKCPGPASPETLRETDRQRGGRGQLPPGTPGPAHGRLRSMWELRSIAFSRAVLRRVPGHTLVFFGLGSALQLATGLALCAADRHGLRPGYRHPRAGSGPRQPGPHPTRRDCLACLVGCTSPLLRAVFYVAAQLLGAVAEAALLHGNHPTSYPRDLAVNAVSSRNCVPFQKGKITGVTCEG